MILGHPDFSVQPTGQPARDDAFFLHFDHQQVLLREDESGVTLPRWGDVWPLTRPSFQPFELARAGERLIFSAHPHHPMRIEACDALRYHDINRFRTMPPDTASLLASSLHLWRWYQNNRYCGRCAAPLQMDAQQRALRCPECGNLLFPAIAPAIIVAITCGSRILLARSLRYEHYALIAGYVEVGETLEHALRREVREEVGLEVDDIRYLGDQPWGVSGSQMFAFHAHADDRQPLRIQNSELKDARWFDRSETAPLPHRVSIAYELVERFRNGTL